MNRKGYYLCCKAKRNIVIDIACARTEIFNLFQHDLNISMIGLDDNDDFKFYIYVENKEKIPQIKKILNHDFEIYISKNDDSCILVNDIKNWVLL